jgi:hypothetical protein
MFTPEIPGQDKFKKQLHEFYQVLKRLKVECWVWGGFNPDLQEHRYLRQHKNINFLVKNFSILSEDYSREFKSAGYEVEVPGHHSLTIKKDGFIAIFDDLQFCETRCYWTSDYLGKRIIFPEEWICPDHRTIWGNSFGVAGFELEYMLKTHPQLLKDSYRRRKEDEGVITYWRFKLSRRNNTYVEDLPEQISSKKIN